MVIGVPNVGKSSIINQLRSQSLKVKGRASAVGGMPGVTRAVLTKIRVRNDPLVYLTDTPGIMLPNIRDRHVGMKLAICATLKDTEVGLVNIADYLLFLLNRNGHFEYVDFLGLDGPTEDVRRLLAAAARSLDMTKIVTDVRTGTAGRAVDVDRVADYFVRGFRAGKLGRLNLDVDEVRNLAVGNADYQGEDEDS